VRPGLDWALLNHNVDCAVAMPERLKGKTKIIASTINQKGVNVAAAEQ